MPPEPAVLAPARGLADGFLASVERFGDRLALRVAGEQLTYRELGEASDVIAATLLRETRGDEPPLTAVYADRTPTAFAGVLGVLRRGHGYVPLNPTLPAERNRLMLERSGCRSLIVDAPSLDGLEAVLDGCPDPLLIVAPDVEDVGPLARRWSQHTVVGADGMEPGDPAAPPTRIEGAPAYVLFTSGSTGTPKGVTVGHENVTWIVDTMVERYAITEDDRISQTHELTFDVSVWDMFVAWERGACLCCPTRKELIKPGAFIRDAGITTWFSVPSTAIFMKRLGMLKPGAYPRLRWSLFAGEPLPNAVAEAWQAAAPASRVENLYGPTELTIVCMEYAWDPARSSAESEAGVVPIGRPLRGMEALVVDDELREVAPGEVGELLMRGPQVTHGYWREPERTAAAFVVPPGREEIHYRTGDRVRRPVGDRPMTYLGRRDHQIKVRGVRVELGEVEAIVREETRVDAVVAVGWPRSATGADGVVAFVGSEDVDVPATLERLRERLPSHMVPRRILLLPELPLGASGKFDRAGLERALDGA